VTSFGVGLLPMITICEHCTRCKPFTNISNSTQDADLGNQCECCSVEFLAIPIGLNDCFKVVTRHVTEKHGHLRGGVGMFNLINLNK